MAIVSKLFRNRNFILVLSIVIGLAVGEKGAVLTRPVVLPVLALIMTLSTTSITSREFASIKTTPGRIFVALLLNYIVMGGIIYGAVFGPYWGLEILQYLGWVTLVVSLPFFLAPFLYFQKRGKPREGKTLMLTTVIVAVDYSHSLLSTIKTFPFYFTDYLHERCNSPVLVS